MSDDPNDLFICITNNIPSEEIFNSKFDFFIINNLNPRGFGDNHNAVFERFESELFIIVNPDIVLIEKFCLAEFWTLMASREISLTSPVILDAQGKIEDYKRMDVTPYNLMLRWVLNINEKKYFDWYAGMFMIVTSESFKDVCGFSPKFYLYVEDCDFCIRLAAKGRKIGDVAEVCVRHDARRMSRKSLRSFWRHLRSLLIYWSCR
jgi:GT2 family glycosyltransferase